MCTEDKPDDFRVDLNDLGDGRHFARRAAARKNKTTAYISVNGNCSSTIENLITTVPPTAEVIAIGVQESNIHDEDNIVITRASLSIISPRLHTCTSSHDLHNQLTCTKLVTWNIDCQISYD